MILNTMRKALTILAAAAAIAAHADVTLRVTPGSLDAYKDELSAASGKVTIAGTLCASDFSSLTALSGSVETLDLSDIIIIGTRTASPDERGRHHHPDNRIPDNAFFRCNAKEVILPKTSELGNAVFAGALTEKVTLPPYAVRIPDHTFYKSRVKEITNTDRILWIGKEAFMDSPMEVLSFPGLTAASEFAMAGMPELREVTLSSKARLGTGVLMDCPKLSRINGGIKIIPDYFTANSNNTELPSDASEIGKYAFANSSAETLCLSKETAILEEGVCAGMNSLRLVDASQCGDLIPEVSLLAFKGLDTPRIILLVSPGTTSLWKAHDVWGKFKVTDDLDSVDRLASDASGITVTVHMSVIDITSPSPISSVEVFDQGGFLIYHEKPGGNRHTFSVSAIPGTGAAIIKVCNAEGSKVIKTML